MGATKSADHRYLLRCDNTGVRRCAKEKAVPGEIGTASYGGRKQRGRSLLPGMHGRQQAGAKERSVKRRDLFG
ncbi:hypothetical protein SAMN05192564_103310 [Paraburkholderia sartisoli]|uniref:Uncharacterized protein n=1 Tax=Paraburkholderia sartisoli TaxID=83784 RepID=A0A1H4EEJ7_9BURK|nr:hypothetical protein SAMN05192564_103310 [Paraburkholderia sartisoli]